MLAQILHFVPMHEAPNRIRELRMQAGLSQQGLGDRIHVSKVTISDLERGNMALTLDYMRRIADALGMMPADLLSLQDNPGALSLDERHLLNQLRGARPEDREKLIRMADVIAPAPPAPEDQDRKRA